MKRQHIRRGTHVRKYLANLFLGLCVIAVGIGYLGNYLDFLPWTSFTLFFPAWGTLFLIIPSVYFLIRYPFSWFWLICLLGGVLILLSKLEIYPLGTAVAICLAILVILIGIRIILAPLFRRARQRRMRRIFHQKMDEEGVHFSQSVETGDSNGSYSVTFGNRTIDMSGQDFNAATLNASFGQMVFNLTGAHIVDCAVIDATCSFGELTIRLPAYVRVEVTRNGGFSQIANSHAAPTDPNAPVVYVNATCSFGEIRIQ